MKTVMDVVIELRGSIGGIRFSIGGIHFSIGELYIAFHNDTATYNLVTLVEHRSLNGDLALVCSLSEFSATVAVLSHAPWIKGASLEEYQAADKEVLKVESKTVEVDGMVYEIGKYYLFCDSASVNKVYDTLALVRKDEHYWFVTWSGSQWRRCKLADCETGTITPAPVKLIDGEVYSFTVGKVKSAGIYLDRIKTLTYYGGHVPLSAVNPDSITRLVPEVK